MKYSIRILFICFLMIQPLHGMRSFKGVFSHIETMDLSVDVKTLVEAAIKKNGSEKFKISYWEDIARSYPGMDFYSPVECIENIIFRSRPTISVTYVDGSLSIKFSDGTIRCFPEDLLEEVGGVNASGVMLTDKDVYDIIQYLPNVTCIVIDHRHMLSIPLLSILKDRGIEVLLSSLVVSDEDKKIEV